MRKAAVLIMLGLFGVSNGAWANCYYDEWGYEVCEQSSESSSDQSYWDHAAETVEEAWRQLNDTDGDSKLEEIADDPYWDE